MLCPNPITLTAHRPPVPCGQCMACRVNQSRFWVGRILLEWYHAPESWFVTLTLSDDNLRMVYDAETGEFWQTLDPDDTRLWLARWRKLYGSQRFFLVGEYGDKSQRPHYHAILFDVSRYTIQAKVDRTWELGMNTVFEMNEARARYVAQYCLKKMNRRHYDLHSRYPEYRRGSTRPPLGYLAVQQISYSLTTRRGAAFLAEKGDVPGQFRLNGRTYPLGHYWMNWLREEHGIPKKVYGPEEYEAPEGWAIEIARAREAAAKVGRRGTRRKQSSESV